MGLLEGNDINQFHQRNSEVFSPRPWQGSIAILGTFSDEVRDDRRRCVLLEGKKAEATLAYLVSTDFR